MKINYINIIYISFILCILTFQENNNLNELYIIIVLIFIKLRLVISI